MKPFLEHIKQHLVPSKHNAYRPHLLRGSWLGFFVALILVVEGFLVTNLVVRQSSQNFLAAVVPGEIIALTNVERNQNHVGLLQENALLTAAAQAKANDMASKGYFSHIGPGNVLPWSWIEGAGYHYQSAGENLAVRFIDSKDVVQAWMASPTHKANIVKNTYTQIGVGVAQGFYMGQLATYVVQYFASPNPLQNQSASVAQTNLPFFNPLLWIEAEPLTTTQWALGSIAFLLLITLFLSIVLHIQIQHFRSIVTTMVIVSLSLIFIVSNHIFLSNKSQTASSLDAASSLIGTSNNVVLPSSASSIEN